jgi:hypothetical protein
MSRRNEMNTNYKFQKHNSVNWVNIEEKEAKEILGKVIERFHNSPSALYRVTSMRNAIDKMEYGDELHYGDEWYQKIRLEPKEKQAPVEKFCSACGHYSTTPMVSSFGTVCPDCYDKFSS